VLRKYTEMVLRMAQPKTVVMVTKTLMVMVTTKTRVGIYVTMTRMLRRMMNENVKH
jgi:hypothetical protein